MTSNVVTLGDALQILTTVGGLVWLYIGLRDRLTKLEVQMAPMWADFLARIEARRATDHVPDGKRQARRSVEGAGGG